MKKFIACILIFILALTCCCFAAEGDSTYYLDDTELIVTGSWSRSFLTTGCYNGTAAVGSSGASARFSFFGSACEIYGLTYYNSGYYYVYLDGQLVGGRRTVGQSTDYQTGVKLFEAADLTPGEHFVTIVCSSDYVTRPDTSQSVSGRLYLDYVAYSGPIAEQSEVEQNQLLLILIALLTGLICITNLWRNGRLPI